MRLGLCRTSGILHHHQNPSITCITFSDRNLSSPSDQPFSKIRPYSRAKETSITFITFSDGFIDPNLSSPISHYKDPAIITCITFSDIKKLSKRLKESPINCEKNGYGDRIDLGCLVSIPGIPSFWHSRSCERPSPGCSRKSTLLDQNAATKKLAKQIT